MILNNKSSFDALPKRTPVPLDEPLHWVRFFNLSQMENWKDIPGYEGYYQVSDLGRVKSLKKQMIKKRHNTEYIWNVKEKILKLSTDNKNYKNARLYKNGLGVLYKVHRLVMMSFFGKSDLVVNHKDFNTSNNCLNNLEYITQKENCEHYWENNQQTSSIKVYDKHTGKSYRSISQALKAYCYERNLKFSEGNRITLIRNNNNRWVFY
jgi:hypothetical protein